jgi:aldose 1-epimerase
VTYSLTNSSDLHISYYATTTKATIVNLTNHTYFNLSGDFARKITDHRLHLSCSRYLPVDETQIPTGEMRLCSSDPAFDFTSADENGPLLGERIPEIDGGGAPGLDHNFIVDTSGESSGMRHIATLTEPLSGRQLVLHGTQPGVQVYTSNFLTKENAEFPFVQHNAICLETQHFPNAINEPSFPDCVLRPGEIYYHESLFSFRVVFQA